VYAGGHGQMLSGNGGGGGGSDGGDSGGRIDLKAPAILVAA